MNFALTFLSMAFAAVNDPSVPPPPDRDPEPPKPPDPDPLMPTREPYHLAPRHGPSPKTLRRRARQKAKADAMRTKEDSDG
jgi:hypothetical protein